RLLQGRAALLLSRLVGRRTDALRLRQPAEVERAAEKLQGGSRAGRSLRQHLDDGEVRSSESASTEAPGRCRGKAACVFAGDHGRVLRGRQRTPQGSLGRKPGLQEGPGFDDRLPQRRLPLVAGRRILL